MLFRFQRKISETEHFEFLQSYSPLRIAINCDNVAPSCFHVFISPAEREEPNIFQEQCSSQDRSLLKGDTSCILHVPAPAQELLWWYVTPHLCTALQESTSALGHPQGLLNPKLAKQPVNNKAEAKPQQPAGALLSPWKGAENGHWSHEKNINERIEEDTF